MTPRRTLATVLELFDFGVELQRQNLRRQDPAASDREISDRLSTWLRTRPGAEFGDTAGSQVTVRGSEK